VAIAAGVMARARKTSLKEATRARDWLDLIMSASGAVAVPILFAWPPRGPHRRCPHGLSDERRARGFAQPLAPKRTSWSTT
jgi:hypothetical protein